MLYTHCTDFINFGYDVEQFWFFYFKLTFMKLKSYMTSNPFFIYNPHKS